MIRLPFPINKNARIKSTSFRQALSEFSKSLTLIVDLQQLKENIVGKIQEIIQVERIFISLLEPDTGQFRVVESRGHDLAKTSSIIFYPGDNLVHWLTVNQTPLVLSETPGAFQYLSEQEQARLNEIGVELVFPLMAMNRITGMIFLGKKTSGEKFTKEEINHLSTLLGPAALALENASLYHQQKTRLRKMYRTDRLATLGQLAAGAAHEIRNPLTSIRSTMQYLKDDSKNEATRELIGDLIQEVDRIDGIINDLLSFSRPREPQMESVDLRQLLEQVIGLVSTAAKKQQVDLRLFYQSEQIHLTADSSQLKQVFLNILMNALEAMEGKGSIDITVDLQNLSNSRIQNRKVSYFLLIFKDTGIGIPEEYIEHIFDPFYTTKNEGTGLGLSIAYSIIQQHGGDIEIESKVKGSRKLEMTEGNHGTKVTIKLPARN